MPNHRLKPSSINVWRVCGHAIVYLPLNEWAKSRCLSWPALPAFGNSALRCLAVDSTYQRRVAFISQRHNISLPSEESCRQGTHTESRRSAGLTKAGGSVFLIFASRMGSSAPAPLSSIWVGSIYPPTCERHSAQSLLYVPAALTACFCPLFGISKFRRVIVLSHDQVGEMGSLCMRS